MLFFALDTLRWAVRPPFRPELILVQMAAIGVGSVFIVTTTSFFTGVVLALQANYAMRQLGAEGYVGGSVAISLARELAPVLTALFVIGRSGSAISTEIGTMRVTEQIDALTTLSTNPMKYLVAPRLIAGLAMLPLLVIVADIIGVFGGYLVSIYKLGFNPGVYIKNTIDFMETMDVVSGLVKAAVFGYLVALMGCYHGYQSRGGAQGVGAATTNAVVSASILILTFNYAITELFFSR